MSFICGEDQISGPVLTTALIFYFVYAGALIKIEYELLRRTERRSSSQLEYLLAGKDSRPQRIMSLQLDLDNEGLPLFALLGRCFSSAEPMAVNQAFMATDQRDTIFALLGIVNDREELNIRPDYSKSCRSLFIGVARSLLRQRGLTVLSFAQSSKIQPDLP